MGGPEPEQNWLVATEQRAQRLVDTRMHVVYRQIRDRYIDGGRARRVGALCSTVVVFAIGRATRAAYQGSCDQ